MAAEQDDIYGDLNPEEADDSLQSEADALYDDVLTGSVNTMTSVTLAQSKLQVDVKPDAVGGAKPAGDVQKRSGRFTVIVGLFSWWTSDTDLIMMAMRLGVRDVLEVKFAENKTNGQSRGYAVITVSSDFSAQRLIQMVSQCKINDQELECRAFSHYNMRMFENRAEKRIPLRSNSKNNLEQDDKKSAPIPPPTDTCPFPLMPMFPPVKPPPIMPSYYSPPPPPLPPPPFLSMPPPPFPPHHPPTPFRGVHGMPPPSHPPAPHINPAFFSSGYDAHRGNTVHNTQRDPEFEELINRNRTVASSAITKAMSAATKGNHSMAIETLLTAIAVIRQSRVYTDERSRTLVESLKDCLYSVENESSSRKRHRSRERVRSRERDRHRERSSSTEREEERERGRERNHRDRY